MKLSVLARIHDAIFVMAFLGAVFLGMTLSYSLKESERKGEIAGAAKVLVKMNPRQLSEFDI